MTLQLAETTVGEVMSVDPVTVAMDASVEEAQQLLRAHHITGLPVVDQHGWLIGVLSQSDMVWGPGGDGATAAAVEAQYKQTP